MNIQNSAIASRQVARAAGTVMVAFVLSQLIGLMRQILVAGAFGTNLEIEAFAAANRVSETLFNLVAGGALGSAFIPTFTTLLARDDKSGAWRLASSIGNLVLVITCVLGILAAILAPQVVRYLLAPGFANDPYKEALTISLLRLMLPSAVIFAISGLVMGVLNSHQKFFIPALAPSMYSLGVIFGVLFLAPKMGIYGLAWGVLVGASLHLILQLPTLLRLGGVYAPTFGLSYAPVREVGRLIGPRLLGVAVVQINFWVNVWLASQLVEGSVNGVIYAFSLMLMPQAIIAQSVAIAAMPTFSAQFALGKLGDLRTTLANSLRGVLLLAIPATFGLVVLRKELVATLFQRGEFSTFSTDLVAWALLWFALGLVGHSVVEVMSRSFYAMHDTRTPVLVGIVAMSLNVIFSFAFMQIFSMLGWMPHGGLALANSFATGLEMIGLLVIMRRRLSGLEGRHVIDGVVRATLASLVMLVGIFAWTRLAVSMPFWVIAFIGVAIGGFMYLVTSLMFRVPEVSSLLRIGLTRLKNASSQSDQGEN